MVEEDVLLAPLEVGEVDRFGVPVQIFFIRWTTGASRQMLTLGTLWHSFIRNEDSPKLYQ